MSLRGLLKSVACYLAVILLILGFAVLRVKTLNRYAVQSAPDTISELEDNKTPADPNSKPFFSLVTSHTYSSTDNARVFVNYRGLSDLDFRVYKVKDPVKFFKGLDNPHQVGEDEEGTAGLKQKHNPTFLEKVLAFKKRFYSPVQSYVRGQLQNQARHGFNQHFRPDNGEEPEERTPLNVSDYARVPLLNPDQMIRSWREKLPPLEDMYERKRISLGKQEPGVYLVEAVNGDLRAFGIVIVTNLILVEKRSTDGQLMVYAADRESGSPLDRVHIEFAKGKETVKQGDTGKDGLFRTKFDKPKQKESDDVDESAPVDDTTQDEPVKQSFLAMATSGSNFAISDLDSFYFGGGEGDEEEGDSSDVTSYIYTDRPVYRPAQTVYFKGILRQQTENGYKLLPAKTASVSVQDNQGASIFEKELPVSSRGTFSGDLTLPDDAALGSYQVQVTAGDSSASGSFSVEEYKKPEYKVNVTTDQKFATAGSNAKFVVSAKYFFGSPVAKADVKYQIYRSPYDAWWHDDSEDDTSNLFGVDPTASDNAADEYDQGGSMLSEGEGKLDAQGRLEVNFPVPQPAATDRTDFTYRLEATVTDQSRRGMDASASFVGVRGNTVATATTDKYVYFQGDPAKILVKTSDHDGKPVQTHVKLQFVERHWEKVTKRTDEGYEYPGYEVADTPLSSGTVDTNGQGEGTFNYTIPRPGAIHILTTVTENGRDITWDGGSIWASDRNSEFSDYSYEESEAVKLVPDKKSYKPGETAHVLALLPKEGAHLLVSTELKTVMNLRQIDVKGRSTVIDVPIEAKYAPDVFLDISYVRSGVMYSQSLMIVVPATDKFLKLDVIPNKKEYKPREPVSYTVMARNADGSPAAGAEVSFGLVDESIYSVSPETVPDIRSAFYGQRFDEVQTSDSTNYEFSGYAGKKVINLAQNRKTYQLADFKTDNSQLVNAVVRKVFKDTATWQPNVVTGADGKATVQLELPDNLTTWRATARAVTADTKVGWATSKIVERKDVIIRMATPRFTTQGDTVVLSGIVHNYLKNDVSTQISLDVNGGQLQDRAQQMVTIPSQGEYRIDWRVSVPQTGDLKILAKALTNTESDALETSIPIVARGLKQTKGETVSLTDDEVGRSFNYNFSSNVDQNTRSLRIEVSPSIAGTLFGALDYLTAYPYGCTEQTMSAFLPTVIVKETLKNVQSASISDKNDIDKKVRVGLKRLYAYQHDDGGWGWWKDDPTDPFMSAYVVDGLTMAKKAGYQIDDSRLDRGREKVKALLDSGKNDDNKDIDTETRAYLVYALNESGSTDAKYVNVLFNSRTNLQPYGRALLAMALESKGDNSRAKTVANEIESSAVGDEGLAHWSSRYKSYGMDQSDDIEATALSLKALSHLSPQSALLPRAARWLVANRKNGTYWQSTKETAFAIYGLTDYVKSSNEQTPNYSLEVYLNGQQVLQKQITSADAASPQNFVIQKRGGEVGNANEIKVVKHGPGVLYLMTTVVTYTNDEDVAAQSSPQLKLDREYLRLKIDEGVDGTPSWKTEALSGDIHSGDLIVSKLTVQGAAGRYLMLEDPIPAGCEQVDNVSGIDLNYSTNGWTDWYSSREFRDNRTVFFLNYFNGKAMYQYAMRVQEPGQFRIAPARVEEMYQPSVQSNTTNGRMTILDVK